MTNLLALINRHRILQSHIQKLVFEYYRADSVQTYWDHCYIAIIISFDHSITAAELLEDTIIGAIADIPGIKEGSKVLDAPIGPAYVLLRLHYSARYH